jgi:hypothetical protein
MASLIAFQGVSLCAPNGTKRLTTPSGISSSLLCASWCAACGASSRPARRSSQGHVVPEGDDPAPRQPAPTGLPRAFGRHHGTYGGHAPDRTAVATAIRAFRGVPPRSQFGRALCLLVARFIPVHARDGQVNCRRRLLCADLHFVFETDASGRGCSSGTGTQLVLVGVEARAVREVQRMEVRP